MRFFLFFVLLSFSTMAQIPAGYYNAANGLTGQALKEALHSIIDNHTVVSYNGLWNAFYDTDRKSTGKVWDIYSDVPGGSSAYNFTFFSDQCGSYSVEGDCYNREHSWPQSWFNSENGPVSDLFHVYPTDGKVNGERDNFPYGNVGTTIYFESTNGSKLGITIDQGYNTVVFEPIDEYKGDLARSYFYMSTRYFSEDANWTNSAATVKSEIKTWELAVLLHWHHFDPVDAKEIARNNSIYSDYQHNRNPYIDHPEWADSVWGQLVQEFLSFPSVSFSQHQFVVYPNPTHSDILISGLDQFINYQIQLIDAKGVVVSSLQSEGKEMVKIANHQFSSGLYIVQLQSDSEFIQMKLVVD